MADVPMLVISENTSSERRITLSWTITQLKAKLEPVTGVPPSCQSISMASVGSGADGRVRIASVDEESTRLSEFQLLPYAELHVVDTRPRGARPNYTDTSGVEKYVMPEEQYASKTDSVLAWKKVQKLGRFDPDAPKRQAAKVVALAAEVAQRKIEVGRRCRIQGDDTRRGEVRYVGEVTEIQDGLGGIWVGIQFDEPVGKNDGSLGGTRYWGEPSELKYGVFVRPDRVEIGDWPVLDDLESDEDMEEI